MSERRTMRATQRVRRCADCNETIEVGEDYENRRGVLICSWCAKQEELGAADYHIEQTYRLWSER